jgi:hypothetical protein
MNYLDEMKKGPDKDEKEEESSATKQDESKDFPSDSTEEDKSD